MKTSELLHFAFRARDPLASAAGTRSCSRASFSSPGDVALGIVIVKINHPEAVFNGLLEFWPWDLEWDGHAAVFRKIKPQPSPTSYGQPPSKLPRMLTRFAANSTSAASRIAWSHGPPGF